MVFCYGNLRKLTPGTRSRRHNMNRKYKNLVLNLIQKELWSWTPKIKV
jgi:hypothetical protein